MYPCIPLQKEISVVMKLFDALKGCFIYRQSKFVGLLDEHTLHNKELTIHWKEAARWVEWWTCLPYLKVLHESFSEVTSPIWKSSKGY